MFSGYGGWVAPNIYYLGYCGVVQYGGLRIAGLSGIYNYHDYNKGQHDSIHFGCLSNGEGLKGERESASLCYDELLTCRINVDGCNYYNNPIELSMKL